MMPISGRIRRNPFKSGYEFIRGKHNPQAGAEKRRKSARIFQIRWLRDGPRRNNARSVKIVEESRRIRQ